MEDEDALSDLEALVLLMLLAEELSPHEVVEVLAPCAGRTGKPRCD